MIPALLAAGTVLQIAGQYSANMDQSAAELQNAEFYRQQRLVAEQDLAANLQKSEQDYAYKQGQLQGAVAKGGADVSSGSALLQTARLAANHIEELKQIQANGDLQIKMAYLKATQSQSKADTLSSPGYNLMQAATTGLNMATASEKNFFKEDQAQAKLMQRNSQLLGGSPYGTTGTGYLGVNTNLGG